MANEITLSASVYLNNPTNKFVVSWNPGAKLITQTNVGVFENTVALTTTDTKLSIVNLTTYGVGWLENIGTAGTVSVGVDSTAVIRIFERLKPGEGYPLRFVTGSTYRAQMESGTGTLRIGILED